MIVFNKRPRGSLVKSSRFLSSTNESRQDFRFVLLIFLNAVVWAVAVISDSEWSNGMAALIGCGVALWWWWRELTVSSRMVQILQIGGFSLMALLNFGYLIAWIIAKKSLTISFAALVEEYLGLTLSDYARAMVFVVLFSTFLTLYARLRFFKREEEALAVSLRALMQAPSFLVVIFTFFILCVSAILLVKGVIGYRSFGVEGMGESEIPWFMAPFSALMALQVPFNVYLMKNGWRKKSVFLNLVAVLGVGSSLFIAFTGGRTGFVFTGLMHFFYWIIFSTSRIRPLTLFLIIIAALLVMYPVSVFNNFIRSSASGVSDARHRTLGTVLMEAGKSYQHEDSQEAAKEANAINLATRPLVAHPIASLQNLPNDSKNFGFGREYLNAFMWIIPRQLFSGKAGYAVQEVYIEQQFGVYYPDTAESIYLSGYLNFGWLGVLLGPLPIVLMWGAVLWMLRQLESPFTKLLVFSLWPGMYIQYIVEASTVAWFSNFRTAVALFIVGLLCDAFYFNKYKGFVLGQSHGSRVRM